MVGTVPSARGATPSAAVGTTADGEQFDGGPGATYLRAGGVSVVVQALIGGMPVIAYWGEDLGALTAPALRALCVAGQPPSEKEPADASVRPGVIPLASAGWMGRPGLVGHRSGGADWAARPGLTAAAGGARPSVPEPVRVAGPAAVTYRLADEEIQIAVDLTIELLPSGLLRTRAALRNHGSGNYELHELSLALPVPLTADEVLDFTGRWGQERIPQRTVISAGCHLREGRRGRTGFDAPMMVFCGARGFGFEAGPVWGLHVAHSGNHRTWVERTNTGRQVLGGGELLLPGEIVLEPGQIYTSPWIYGQHADGLDEAARRVHRWERTLPSHPGPHRPVTLNVWEAVYFNHDFTVLKELAERAAQIGVERFVLDDGWFLGRRDERTSLGDWQVDPDTWPQGLHPLVDHVRGLGMQFGLWFEPEMVSVDSVLATEHPDWILRARSDLPIEQRYQQVLNLTIPEAREYVRASMSGLIGEYRIDYLKWDHNRDLIDAGTAGGAAAVHEQTLATYELMDRLRADHPGLEIEACSSGGGRVDLEMVRHAQRFWISDCIDPHERQSMMRWSAQMLAPELTGTHVASARSHTTGRAHDLDFRAATAIWGHMGFELDLLAVAPEDLDTLAAWVAFYQAHRDLLLTGDVVRRDVADASLWLHGVVSPERGRALYQLTSRFRSPMSPRGMMPLPGLAGDRTYRVRPVLLGSGPAGLTLPPWFGEDVQIAGSVLALSGVHTPAIYPDQALVLEVVDVAAAATTDAEPGGRQPLRATAVGDAEL